MKTLHPTPFTLHPSKGFTLVEALLSITILGVMGIIMANLLSQSFQLNSKSQLISKIKQNGQNALSIIDESVRNADSIVCPTPTQTTSNNAILVTAKNGTYTRFNLHLQQTNVNGYIGKEVFGNYAEYCDYAKVPIITSQEIVLTDNSDLLYSVSIKSGTFTSNAVNNVTINFDLGSAVNAPRGVSNQSSNVHFQTTLNVRQR